MSKVVLPSAVLLAGGRAQRMGGGDKGRLQVGGQDLFHRVIARITPQVEGVVLNANGASGRFADLGLPVVPDSVAGWPGPLGGVLAGLDWAAARGADRIVTVAADTPFFPTDLVARLIEGADQTQAPIALAATSDGPFGKRRHPTFGLWSVALRDDLRTALSDGVRKVVSWTERHGAVDVVFEEVGPVEPFFNINTPEDLALAERLAWQVAT